MPQGASPPRKPTASGHVLTDNARLRQANTAQLRARFGDVQTRIHAQPATEPAQTSVMRGSALSRDTQEAFAGGDITPPSSSPCAQRSAPSNSTPAPSFRKSGSSAAS